MPCPTVVDPPKKPNTVLPVPAALNLPSVPRSTQLASVCPIFIFPVNIWALLNVFPPFSFAKSAALNPEDFKALEALSQAIKWSFCPAPISAFLVAIDCPAPELNVKFPLVTFPSPNLTELPS